MINYFESNMSIMRQHELIVIIDHNIESADHLKHAIEARDGSFKCLCFRYADEASFAISQLIERIPAYIFIGANTVHLSFSEFLLAVRSRTRNHNTKIVAFADVMPSVLAQTFVDNGASYAFQTPISKPDIRRLVAHVLN